MSKRTLLVSLLEYPIPSIMTHAIMNDNDPTMPNAVLFIWKGQQFSSSSLLEL